MHIRRWLTLLLAAALAVVAQAASSDAETLALFRKAEESRAMFARSYGYAVFPTIGKGGIGIGGAYGRGRVYAQGKLIGETSMTQLSLGFQFGGQGYSEIIFFQKKAQLDEFTSGNFEFGADVGAVAITAGVSASASTEGGASTSASGTKKDAIATGGFHKGVAVFTIAKGGLMYQAAVQGQKFSYTPK